MDLPTLDARTRREIDGICDDDFSKSYAYHSNTFVGIEAVIHTYLCGVAREIHPNSLKEYIGRFKIENLAGDGQKDAMGGPTCSLRTIQKEGIFIPKRRFYGKRDVRIMLFNPHQVAYLIGSEPEHKNGCILLGLDTYEGKREWSAQDFLNPGWMNRGIQFGKDLWKHTLHHFDQSKDGLPEYDIPVQPQHVTDVARRLIDYYSQIVDSIKVPQSL